MQATLFPSNLTYSVSRISKVPGVSQLAAEYINGIPSGVIMRLENLPEDRFSCTLLISMSDSFQLIVRIPCLVTLPKSYSVTGEVATTHILRFESADRISIPGTGTCASSWNL